MIRTHKHGIIFLISTENKKGDRPKVVVGALFRSQLVGLFFIYHRILSGSALLFGFHRLRVERDSIDIECNFT